MANTEYYGGSPGGTIFDHPDQIGSATAASDYTGANFQERLYYPFGEFWNGGETVSGTVFFLRSAVASDE